MREEMMRSLPAESPTTRESQALGPLGRVTEAQARSVAALIGLDLDESAFDVAAFRRGMEVELEHGRRDPETNVTDDDPVMTGKIAWAHLKELPDYYERLEEMEAPENHVRSRPCR
jgi:uncharacterized protein DUF5661